MLAKAKKKKYSKINLRARYQLLKKSKKIFKKKKKEKMKYQYIYALT